MIEAELAKPQTKVDWLCTIGWAALVNIVGVTIEVRFRKHDEQQGLFAST